MLIIAPLTYEDGGASLEKVIISSQPLDGTVQISTSSLVRFTQG